MSAKIPFTIMIVTTILSCALMLTLGRRASAEVVDGSSRSLTGIVASP